MLHRITALATDAAGSVDSPCHDVADAWVQVEGIIFVESTHHIDRQQCVQN